jgi:excisionase family DNA binding protein
MTHNPTAHWPTKREAANRASVSLRTIERAIKAGRIEARPSPRGLLCNPQDVAALQPAAKPAIAPPQEQQQQPAGSESIASIVATLAALLSQRQRAALPDPAELRFLTLDQAAAEAGLSARYLLAAIKDGKLSALRDRRAWRISRRALQRWLSEIPG